MSKHMTGSNITLFFFQKWNCSFKRHWSYHPWCFLGGSEGKQYACDAGDPSSIPGLRRSPGEGNGYPFQFLPGELNGQRSLTGYSPRGHKELDTTERLTQQQDVLGFPGNSAGKKSTLSLGDPSSIPGLGRSPGEGIGYLLQNSWAFLVALMVKNLPAMWETWVQSLGWEDSLEESMATHSSILAWRNPLDRGVCQAIVHSVMESWTRLNNLAQHKVTWRLPRWLGGKESTCQAGDSGSIPEWRRSPGEWNGNPFQYSFLGNPMDRGVWWAAVHGVAKELDTTEQLSNNKSYLRPVRSLSGNSALPSLPPSLIQMF